MQLNGELQALENYLSEKQRRVAIESLGKIKEAIAEAEHLDGDLRAAFTALSAYDSTFTNITLEEGIRRLRLRIDEEHKEHASLRRQNEKAQDVITACKVALIDTVTADHRWHVPEENCPHARCIALNKIEALRG